MCAFLENNVYSHHYSRKKYSFKNQNIIDIIKNKIKNNKADSDT